MKRLFVFVPGILLVLVLLNSFEVKEKESENKKTEGVPDAKEKRSNSRAMNIIFKSTDGGQTWQDISEGLPVTEQPVNFFAGDSDLYLQVRGAIYHSKRNLETPVWEKAQVPDQQNDSSRASTSTASNRPAVSASNFDGQVYQKMNIVESEGVLVTTGTKGIMRSTDNGEHWNWVITEGGVGIAVERIEGGFAAITYNTETKSRTIHISLDNGKTWKDISNGLRPSALISSIKQMGKYLICGHPDGIFRSSDMGKTWNSVHSSVDKGENNVFKFVGWNSPYSEPRNVFSIYVSGNVLYALAGSAGC